MRKKVFETTLFAMLGALMFLSKIVMEALPNIHLLAMFTVTFTVVFRKKALIPIYVYVLLNGLVSGFDIWWVPYLYIWTILWGVTMMLPKAMPKSVAVAVYAVLCGLHGLAFGVLYAPAQALFFGFDFNQTVVWIAHGLLFDIIHCVSNTAAGLLVVPLSLLLKKATEKSMTI